MAEHIDNQERHADPRTNEELLHIALSEADEDIVWEAISALHRRGSPDVFEQAYKLCTSGEARERRVGADILGQLSLPDGTFPEEAFALLLGMLEREQEPEVLCSIAVALGHHHDPRVIEPLVRLKNHPDEDVRFGVVIGLMGLEEALAIQTLIELSTDADASVRDWATLGLGSQIETDTPSIREALMARLTDEGGDTSGEAMVGLARRRDVRVVEPLLAALEDGWFGSLLMEATAELGDPRLYPVLVRLREEWEGEKDDWLYRMLEEAIEKCHPSHIRAVIFDFGGVLVHTEDRSMHQKWETHLGISEGELSTIVFGSDVAVQAAVGQVTTREIWQYVADKFNLDAEQIRMLEQDFWAKQFLDAELVVFLHSLRPRYKTAILSNAWLDAREVFTHIYAVADLVDEIIISAEEGIKKPDSRIFQLAAQRLGVQLDETIFVDDMAPNVEAACALGMRGIQFKTTAQAIADVRQYLEE